MQVGRTIVATLALIAGALVALLFGTLTGAANAQDAEQAAVETVVLPARVEAEAFDTGGEGVAYHEEDTDLAGDLRVDEGVDVYRKRTGTDAAGDPIFSELIGRTRDGEWVEYTVTAAEAGDFEVKVVLASGATAPGTVTVEIDGEPLGNVSGDTDGWYDWATRSAGLVSLDAGEHVVRLLWEDGANVNVDAIDIVSTTPTCDTGLIEAEDATVSGRFTEVSGVPAASGDAYVVVEKGTGGWWRGESRNYVEFCVGVETGGEYIIDALVRAPSSRDNSFYVSVDGGPLVEFIVNTNSASFGFRWDAVNDAGVIDPLTKYATPATRIIDPLTWELTPGDHTIRFYLRRDGAELDAIQLSDADRGYPEGCSALPSDCAALFALSPEFFTSTDPCSQSSTIIVRCTNGRISEITIQSNTVSGPPRFNLDSLPPEIGELTGLQTLILQASGIAELPPEIGNLSSLRFLSLEGATLLTELPPEIGNLSNLEVLNVEGTSLVQLPPEIGNLTNMLNLWLSQTQLTELPPEIGNLTELGLLTLEGLDLTTLPDEFVNLTNLFTLELDGTCLDIDNADVRAMLDRLEPGWECAGGPVPPGLSAVCGELVRLDTLAELPAGVFTGADGRIYFSDLYNALWAYDPATGEASPVNGDSFGRGAAVAADGTVYYWRTTDFENGRLELNAGDPATGETTGLGIFEFDVLIGKPSVVIASDGIVYTYATSDSGAAYALFSYDPSTGAAEEIETVSAGSQGWFDPLLITDDDVLILVDTARASAALWAYDPALDSLSPLALDTGITDRVLDASVGADGLVYFTADSADQQSELWVFDPADGTTTNLLVSAAIGAAAPAEVATDPVVASDGLVYFFSDSGADRESLWVYDPTTGEATDTGLAADAGLGITAGLDGEIYVIDYDPTVLREDLWVYRPCH